MKLLYDLFGQLYEARVFDPRSDYLSEVGIRVSLLLFYILGYILQSDRYLVFGILNYRPSLFMLSIIRVFFIFSILAHSRSDIKFAVQRVFYCKAVLSGQYYLASFEVYTAGSAEDVYIMIIVQST